MPEYTSSEDEDEEDPAIYLGLVGFLVCDRPSLSPSESELFSAISSNSSFVTILSFLTTVLFSKLPLLLEARRATPRLGEGEVCLPAIRFGVGRPFRFTIGLVGAAFCRCLARGVLGRDSDIKEPPVEVASFVGKASDSCVKFGVASFSVMVTGCVCAWMESTVLVSNIWADLRFRIFDGVLVWLYSLTGSDSCSDLFSAEEDNDNDRFFERCRCVCVRSF